MTTKNSDEQLRAIFESVLGAPSDQINDDSSPDNLPAWDSVAHLNLVMAIEETFGLSFTPEETMDLTSFKLLRWTIEEKLGPTDS